MSTSSEKSRDRNEDLLEWYRRHLEKENDKKETLKKFSGECIQVLTLSPDCKLPFNKFTQMYESEFDKSIYVSDYGFGSLTDLFRGLPETLIVTHKYVDWDGSEYRGQIQLTESVRRNAITDRRKKLRNHPALKVFERELVHLRNILHGRRVTIVEFGNYTLYVESGTARVGRYQNLGVIKWDT